MVKAGEIVKVKVLEVDIPRKRISLTMRMDEQASNKPANNRAGSGQKPQRRENKPRGGNQSLGGGAMGNAFADAFAKAKKK